MLHLVMVLVTFVSLMSEPIVGVGTAKPSAVPVVKALKTVVSPFLTTVPPPGIVDRLSPR